MAHTTNGINGTNARVSLGENSNQTMFDFLSKIVNILRAKGAIDASDDEVIKFLYPDELKEKLDLNLSKNGLLNDYIKEDLVLQKLLEAAIVYSVKTGKANFHNQLYGGVDRYGLAGAFLIEVLNTSQYTYEVAPVFTLTEQVVIKESLKIFGYNDGDGIFAPGGSISNMYAMVLARYRAANDVKTRGNDGRRFVAFTSEDAHYSIEKSIHWLGIGINNLIKVKIDKNGKMCPVSLENCIKKVIEEDPKAIPFFVNATCGTTVLGAFDPLKEVSSICKKYNLWLHVDACLGGTLIFSNKYKNRLSGIELSDSMAWNSHKLLGAPLQCALFLVKDKSLLHESNCAGAKYLFQQDKFYDISYDTGDKSVQCGRKTDGFKLWTMWKARGTSGFEYLINNAMTCAEYFRKKISNRDGFKLVLDEFECTNICFWYIPEYMRNAATCPFEFESKLWWEEMGHITTKIKELMVLDGSLMLGYCPLKSRGYPNFFRLVTTCHPAPTYKNMDFVIDQIEKFGKYVRLKSVTNGLH